ncbi:MAG TPA: phosphoribosylanthranilate isomerase, partial [Victivallales bacterium]|nr:phosphoribosylanthranilate isomerase [Victivallales bacterium]
MRVKICGLKTEEDLQVAIKAGADAVGFLVGQLYASTDFILPGTAQRLSKILPPYISPVVVTHLIEADAILDIIKKTEIFNVQLHGGSSLADVKKIRDKLPESAKIIMALHVIDNQIKPEPEDFIPYVNAFLLDSYNKNTKQIGGTGKIHN